MGEGMKRAFAAARASRSKSAWSAALNEAPHDRPILMRHPSWDCLAVVKWTTHDSWSGWCYVETVLSDIAGAVDDSELPKCEWAHVPL